MPLKIYNSISQKKELFKPSLKNKVNIFVCGPTVYDFSHLGHARTYVFFDSFVKYLKEKGYKVFYLQNITDIDDKILARAKEEKTSWKKLALKFEKEYLKDMTTLKVNSVVKYARATEHIEEIISQVERLIKKRVAYLIEDGIYYDISRFKDYGKLSKRTVLQAEDAVSRIDQEIRKKNKGDFCLWKKSKKGEPKWKSPWFLGRPGWHIEDTAISEKYFGPQYDIHGGGRDLIFPHHEAEIAQMEVISGKRPMVKYWLHTGFLKVNRRKMSKSLGNFITIREFLKKYSPRILRFFILKSHYRSPLNYSEKIILQTKKELERIDQFLEKVKNQKPKIEIRRENLKIIKNLEKEFQKVMEDDFNTPKAIATLFKLIRKENSLIEKNKIGEKERREILKFFEKIDRFFCFLFEEEGVEETKKIPKKILELAKMRNEAREKLEWEKADRIREKIKQLGYWIEDTPTGFRLRKL